MRQSLNPNQYQLGGNRYKIFDPKKNLQWQVEGGKKLDKIQLQGGHTKNSQIINLSRYFIGSKKTGLYKGDIVFAHLAIVLFFEELGRGTLFGRQTYKPPGVTLIQEVHLIGVEILPY